MNVCGLAFGFFNNKVDFMTVKISIADQMVNYQNLMNSLIIEKKGMTEEKKAEKKEKIIALSKNLFLIQGNEDLKKTVKCYITEIASLKPGRKLIKALEKAKILIKVQEGDEFYTESKLTTKNSKVHLKKFSIAIFPDDSDFYNTINEMQNERSTLKPQWVSFAHELIHIFHKNSPLSIISIYTKTDILNDMDDLEEQHTIVGFNHYRFSEMPVTDPLAVLCENAFLLALNLPPRIDHASMQYKNLDSNSFKNRKIAEIYYSWLAKNLNDIRTVPEWKKNSKSILVRHLVRHPLAIQSFLDELKKKDHLIIKIINENPELLKEFRTLLNNADLLKKILTECNYQCIDNAIFKHICKFQTELAKDKEFIFNVAKSCTKDIQKLKLSKLLHPSLEADKDIQALLEF
jgi:hypothetical protein